MRIQNREHYANKFAGLRELKREKEEAKRWEKFLIDRAEFDEAMENQLDTYELMMLTIEGR